MRRKAQIVLETALVLVAVTIFLVGIMRVWAWFVEQYKDRWQSYHSNRVTAGRLGSGFVPDGYTKEKLNLFK